MYSQRCGKREPTSQRSYGKGASTHMRLVVLSVLAVLRHISKVPYYTAALRRSTTCTAQHYGAAGMGVRHVSRHDEVEPAAVLSVEY